MSELTIVNFVRLHTRSAEGFECFDDGQMAQRSKGFRGPSNDLRPSQDLTIVKAGVMREDRGSILVKSFDLETGN